jgi:hypothetical protein
MDVMLGLAGLLKDGLGLIFDSLIAKSIINFFKKSNFILLLLRSIGGSIISWLFSTLGLRRLVMSLIPYLWPILALEFGLQGLGIYGRAKSTENPLTSPDFIDRLKLQEENRSDKDVGQVFPTSDGKKGVPLSKARGFFSRSQGELDSGGALNKETNNFIKSKSVMAPEPYELVIPGLSNSRVLYLEEKQAREWGDKRKQYIEILDEYRDIFERKMKGEKQRPGNENVGERLMELQKDHDVIQSEMLDFVEKVAKNTMDPKSNYFKNLMQEVGKAKKGIYNVDFLEQAKQELWDGSFLQEESNRISREILDPIEKSITNVPTQLNDTYFNFTQTADTARSNIIKSTSSARQSVTKLLEDLSQSSKNHKDQITSEPIIITTNVQQSASKPTTESKPASAWNNDFFVKHYYDVSNSPFNIK